VIKWRVPNVTVLPGDFAVFEFGGQICLLDYHDRSITLLGLGYGPVVVLDE